MTPAGRELRTLLEPMAPALHRSAAALWRPEGLRERYLRYLVAMHAVVRASVPLMELALAGCADASGGRSVAAGGNGTADARGDATAGGDGYGHAGAGRAVGSSGSGSPSRGDPAVSGGRNGHPGGERALSGVGFAHRTHPSGYPDAHQDPYVAVGDMDDMDDVDTADVDRDRWVRRTLAAHLPGHIAAERDHDDWLVADMVAAGIAPGPALAGPPPASVAGLVGAQFYWVAHYHPLCLLGYIAVLELHAPAPELAGLLAARTELPPAAFETLRQHAALDTGHSAAILAVLDEADPPPHLRQGVRLSALHTVRGLIDVLDGLSGPTRPMGKGNAR